MGTCLTTKIPPVMRCALLPCQGKAPYERVDRDVARRYELVSRIGRGLGPQVGRLAQQMLWLSLRERCYGVVFEVMLRDRLIRENNSLFFKYFECR